MGEDDVKARIAALAQRDPACARFGASEHRYRLAAPLPEARVLEIERNLGGRLPEDYRSFVLEQGEAGAGPGYGLLPLDRPSQLALLDRPNALRGPLEPPPAEDAEANAAYWKDDHLAGAILLADHGCCALSFLVVHPASPAVGCVLHDVRSAGVGVVQAATSFAHWYEDWLAASEHDPPLVRCPSLGLTCATPNALTNYLGAHATELGKEFETLSVDEVRAALLEIGDGGLATRTGADRFFDDGDLILPCACCHAMLGRFVARGMMRMSQVLPGRIARPGRGAA